MNKRDLRFRSVDFTPEWKRRKLRRVNRGENIEDIPLKEADEKCFRRHDLNRRSSKCDIKNKKIKTGDLIELLSYRNNTGTGLCYELLNRGMSGFIVARSIVVK